MTQTRLIYIVLSVALLPAWGCSTSKLAVGAMIPILENSKTAALASADTRTFYAATPGNLFLLEGLVATDPKNVDLRVSAAMLYFSYAFTLNEPEDEAYASNLYLKGLEHATTALLKNKDLAEIWEAPAEQFASGVGALREKDLPAAVWTVANWSQFISLHLDSTDVLLDIPKVTALLERTCDIGGSYFGGLPHIILGSLHAFRPPLMGGDPEASKASFEKAMEISERRFLLAQYMYARFYTYRIQDADVFEEALLEVLATPDEIMPEYRLLNAIAKEKASRLLGEKDDLF